MTWEEREARSIGNSSAAEEVPAISDELRRQIEAARGGRGQGDGMAQAKQKLTEGRVQAASKLAQVKERVTAAAPGQVQQALGQIQQQASKRPVPVAFVAGLVLGLIIGNRS
jgi:hypothetical protein